MREILPDPSQDNPFERCLFNREKYADSIINLIDNNNNGFVLSIDNDWGMGKTTFIKMLERKISNNFDTIYLNVWENDYETDPLIYITSELKKYAKELDLEDKIAPIIKNVKKITMSVVKSAVFHQLSKFTGEEATKEIISALSNSTDDIIENQIEKSSEREDNIGNLKDNLKSFLENRNNKKPLIIFVDELDRCRPDYSVKFLEVIKHFFSVDNIVFILSIDKNQLGAAIKGFFGSDSINPNQYLKKIIDIELKLPYPNLENFINEKFNDINYDFVNTSFIDNSHFNRVSIALNFFIKNDNVSPRTLNRIINHYKISIRTFTKNNFLDPYALIFLIYLYHCRTELYDNLKSRNTLQLEKILSILKQHDDNISVFDINRVILHVFGSLNFIYNNNLNNFDVEKLIFKKSNAGAPDLFINRYFSEISGYYNNANEFDYFNRIEFITA